MKRLIIGGPHDGQWHEIPSSFGDRVELINREKFVPTPFSSQRPLIKTSIYHRQVLADKDGEQYSVFAADGVNVIQQLILGYREPNEQTDKD